LEPVILPLRQRCALCPIATTEDLVRFADSMVNSLDPDHAVDLWRLSYLSYAATSIHGELQPEISEKIAELDRKLGIGDYAMPAIQYPSLAPYQDLGFLSDEPSSPVEETRPGSVDVLVQIALDALHAHEDDIALTAIMGAIYELQQ
jgi:hypothetical protein